MRVCDKCREPIDNNTKYFIEVQCFNSVGQYIGVNSYHLELCVDCHKKIFGKD